MKISRRLYWICSVYSAILLCGCYSAIPMIKSNHNSDYHALRGRKVLLAPVRNVIFEWVEGEKYQNVPPPEVYGFADSLSSQLFRCLRHDYGDKIGNLMYVTDKNMYSPFRELIVREKLFDGTYYEYWSSDLNGVDYDQSSKHSVFQIDTFSIEIINFPDSKQLHCKDSLILYLGDIHISVVDSEYNSILRAGFKAKRRFVKFNGGYVVWDYCANQYVTVGRLGPIILPLDDLAKRLAEYIEIANDRWLKR